MKKYLALALALSLNYVSACDRNPLIYDAHRAIDLVLNVLEKEVKQPQKSDFLNLSFLWKDLSDAVEDSCGDCQKFGNIFLDGILKRLKEVFKKSQSLSCFTSICEEDFDDMFKAQKHKSM